MNCKGKVYICYPLSVIACLIGIFITAPNTPPYTGIYIGYMKNVWITNVTTSLIFDYDNRFLMKTIAEIYHRQNNTEINESGFFIKLDDEEVPIIADPKFLVPICASFSFPKKSKVVVNNEKFSILSRKKANDSIICHREASHLAIFIMLCISLVVTITLSFLACQQKKTLM